MMKPLETQRIKHVLKFNTGHSKRIALTLKKSVLKYPVQLVQIQREMMWVFDVQVVQFMHYSIKYLFRFIRKHNLIWSEISVEHESTTHITVKYDTCCYWFISPFLAHAVAPHNTFSYQALHHRTAANRQTNSDFGITSSKYKSNINDMCAIISASCVHPFSSKWICSFKYHDIFTMKRIRSHSCCLINPSSTCWSSAVHNDCEVVYRSNRSNCSILENVASIMWFN